MTAALFALLVASCPEAAAFEQAGQQEAACALAQRPKAAPADRATLQRLLDEPEFSRVRNRNTNVLGALWEQLFAWLKRFFQTDEAATFAKAAPFAVLSIAFAIALVALLRFARFRGSSGVAVAASTSANERLELKPAPEHLANAKRLAATAPRDAIREALLALLSSLEQRNLARPDRVKTNRELCRELPTRGAAPELVAQVSARVDWYDRVFYSLAPVGADEAGAFIAGIERLV